MNQIFIAAAYIRLSREDEESSSIENQKAFIQEFVKQNLDIRLMKEKVDDGFSGVNFQRPAFQEMLEEAKRGEINCIIVKDLSRFGRNYIEVGNYLERIFPLLGIRFIAITDQYDSENRSGRSDYFLLPVKNLINDSYSRDISIKVRSQLEAMRRRGEFTGAFAVYGYCKDPENKNQLVKDPYAATIVKKIFEWKLIGMNQQEISERLNQMKILSPLQYKKAMGLKFESGFCQGTQGKWTVTAVNRILKNEVYIGTMVQGRVTTPNYKVKVRTMIEEKDWIKVKNRHEPVVGEAVFRKVNKMLEKDTRTAPKEKKLYLFAGMLFCRDCRQSMVRKTTVYQERRYVYYVCSSYRGGNCKSNHKIREDVLEKTVLLVIRQWFLHTGKEKAVLEKRCLVMWLIDTIFICENNEIEILADFSDLYQSQDH
ncbi:recombinase family protein [Anaeromicropila populeti]|uniref:Site-specific DNA recombinase n=1 Tax=Anaeromicropila populeti TaxID=37658 RepID=A0A1I6JNH3_9FIRM|nr:recombinase family protein [Anaeromicropila populeti]SFR80514.1 Site-specific DNA recombinase [Anaeromicropila populeti]